jgi:hypothetical protein
METKSTLNFLTPVQLIEKYPQMKDWGWTASKIGIFYYCGLVNGKRRMFKSYILESSFLELIEFANLVATKHQMSIKPGKRNNLLTPQEILEKYPECVRKLFWNSHKIGVLFNSGLLLGYRSGREYKALIHESSVLTLIRYINKTNKKRMIRL